MDATAERSPSSVADDAGSSEGQEPPEKEARLGGSSPAARARAARAKLEYLLAPAAGEAGRTPKTAEEEMRAEVDRLEARVRELAQQLGDSDRAAQALGAHADELRELLVRRGEEDLPPRPVSAEQLALRTSPVPRPPAVLGIKHLRCGSCGAVDEVDCRRVFVELGQLYCSDCWSHWERCGWWRPSLRVSMAPPPIREAGGVPCYGAQDAFFLSGFLCAHDDLSLFEALKSELPAGRDFTDWHGGRHLGMQFEGEGARHTAEGEPQALKAAVAKLEAAFGIRASAFRLNLYRSGADYKPMHHDRGRDEQGTPQVTVGASFGGTRELTLLHVASGVTATFPQRNGDVFAFTPELNATFMHGVPKIGFGSPSEVEGHGPRLSLILWGSKVELDA